MVFYCLFFVMDEESDTRAGEFTGLNDRCRRLDCKNEQMMRLLECGLSSGIQGHMIEWSMA